MKKNAPTTQEAPASNDAVTAHLLSALRRALPWLQKAREKGVHESCVLPIDLERTIERAQKAIDMAEGR